MKIRRTFLNSGVLILGSILLLAGLCPPGAQAQKSVEWKILNGWTQDFVASQKILLPFLDKVNQRAAGKMKISWLGPEAVPSFEQLKPVREGVFDAVFTVAAYHSGEISLGNGLDFTYASGREKRAAGMLKIVDDEYRKKANVTYFACIPDGIGVNLVLKKKIDKADLSGLKIRTSAFHDPLVKGLNGAAVRVAPGEIYSSLEKGLVDGFCWPAIGILDYKFYEVSKYLVRPRFFDNNYMILVNLNSWNQLPKDLQDLLTKAGAEIEDEGRAAMVNHLATEEKELQKRGMELMPLPPEEARKFLSVINERSWAELVIQRNPELGPQLKALSDRIGKK